MVLPRTNTQLCQKCKISTANKVEPIKLEPSNLGLVTQHIMSDDTNCKNQIQAIQADKSNNVLFFRNNTYY